MSLSLGWILGITLWLAKTCEKIDGVGRVWEGGDFFSPPSQSSLTTKNVLIANLGHWKTQTTILSLTDWKSGDDFKVLFLPGPWRRRTWARLGLPERLAIWMWWIALATIVKAGQSKLPTHEVPDLLCASISITLDVPWSWWGFWRNC